jgi:pimeloyl-ACP methyl ester carboxylesterase
VRRVSDRIIAPELALPASPRRFPMKTFFLRLTAGLALLYALVVGLFYFNQRNLLFPIPRPARAPAIAGAQLLRVDGAGGSVVALYIPARPGNPTLAHLHGNHQQLADLEGIAQRYTGQGLGFFAIEFPGYGLAGGSPSEPAIDDAAERALGYLRDTLHVQESDTVIYGQSLGTGAAVEMAARGHGARLVLIAPYTSIVDAATVHYPFLPAGLIVKDRFDSFARAPAVKQPVLIIHGTDDEVVPFAMGEKMAARFPRAELVPVEGSHHNDVFIVDGESLTPRVVAFARGEKAP